MAEVTKYHLINNNNGNTFTDLKTQFSFLISRKTSIFISGLLLLFVLFTVLLAFSPSTSTLSSSSPWFFTVNSTFSADESHKSHFSTQSNVSFDVPISQNLNDTHVLTDKVRNFEHNYSAVNTEKHMHDSKLHGNQSSELPINQRSELLPQISSPTPGNQIIKTELGNQISQSPPNLTKNEGEVELKSSDLGALLWKNQVKTNENDTVSSGAAKKQGNLWENLVGCDLYDGKWVRDESYPLYKPGSCKVIDQQVNCVVNGRIDHDYYKLKWMPIGCTLPRLNAKHMLKLLRGKRLVFVGDSLNRNMWESLICILMNAVKNKKKVYEVFGRHRFKTEASYSYVFKDYNCTVEFFVSPFLVQQWEIEDNGTAKETLRLDVMVSDADQYKSADYIVFNTGHWWTHDKTSKGDDYYQEGSHVHKHLDVKEAFRKAITTWAKWVDSNINPQRTSVLFRGYSASHFHGGNWNSGGKCHGETEPIRNETHLTNYPWKMKVFESVIEEMKIPVSFMNVTRLTDYRKDGHPSIYRKHKSEDEKKSPLKYQDCSHWCLPGVPDSWNELLYAELLRIPYMDRQKHIQT